MSDKHYPWKCYDDHPDRPCDCNPFDIDHARSIARITFATGKPIRSLAALQANMFRIDMRTFGQTKMR